MDISNLPTLDLDLPKYHTAHWYMAEDDHPHVVISWANVAYAEIDVFEMTDSEFARALDIAVKSLQMFRHDRRKRLH